MDIEKIIDAAVDLYGEEIKQMQSLLDMLDIDKDVISYQRSIDSFRKNLKEKIRIQNVGNQESEGI